MTWLVNSPSLVTLFRYLAADSMAAPLGLYDVNWNSRNIPMMSPGLQAGVYLQVTSSKSYGKPAKDWVEHQITTLTPSRTTSGTVYGGKVAGHAWTYTTPADATLVDICVGIASAIAALAVPGFVPMVLDGPKVQCDVAAGTAVIFSDASQYLAVVTNVMVQEALLTRGKLVLQVQVKSLESTDTTWSLVLAEQPWPRVDQCGRHTRSLGVHRPARGIDRHSGCSVLVCGAPAHSC
jgi:hypothetical protein